MTTRVCAHAKGADAESRGNRDASLRVRQVEPEQGRIRQATEGPPPNASAMPWLSGTKARRSHRALCQRGTQERLESVETTVRRRRTLFGGFVAHMGKERLLRKVIFREVVGGKGFSGGQE